MTKDEALPAIGGHPGIRVGPAVSVAEVLAVLAAGRDLARGSGPWTVRMIEAADRQHGGRWNEVRVRGDLLRRVVLPRHAGEPCRGDRRELVPAGGATVADAAASLGGWTDEQRRESAECWRRIDAARLEPFTRLVLARAPLGGHADYSDLSPGAALYHLDGFHRLLGWALAGRLDDRAWVDAHLAGGETVGPAEPAPGLPLAEPGT